MKPFFLVLICVAGLQSCSVLNNEIGHDNYLTRIQTSSKCHYPHQRTIPTLAAKSTASLPGGGSALSSSDPAASAFYRGAKPGYYWFPHR